MLQDEQAVLQMILAISEFSVDSYEIRESRANRLRLWNLP